MQEDIDKKELLLQSYENKISVLHAEIKNLNDSLAEKENYIFELKSIKPNSVKREKERIASLENKDNETRFFCFFFEKCSKIFFFFNYLDYHNELMNKIKKLIDLWKQFVKWVSERRSGMR